VIGLSSKTGGKNGKHCPVTETSTIAAIANISVQLFQYRYGNTFRAVTDTTSSVQTSHFQIFLSIHFLCMFDSRPQATNSHGFVSFLDISPSDMNRFKTLKNGEKQIFLAIKNCRKCGEVVAEEE